MDKLTDQEIIEGFERGDEEITRTYFYGYCREAYAMLCASYQLSGKEGLDFLTLAHTYYLKLMTGGWQQLADRKPGTPLRSWMIGGFRFVTLDALKAYNTEWARVDHTVDEAHMELTERYSRAEIYRIIDELCDARFSGDSRAQDILRLSLIYGFKGKEVAAQLGMTPSAVSQRLKKMMDEVVRPYFMEYYTDRLPVGMPMPAAMCEASYDMAPRRSVSRFKFDVALRSLMRRRDDNRRLTPQLITTLKGRQVFVFGSNLQGCHTGGAAAQAMRKFGAVWGVGVGLKGRSYALPTMQGSVDRICPFVEQFVDFAREHKSLNFMVTRVGCGVAGFTPAEVAPLFQEAVQLKNVWLPEDFWQHLPSDDDDDW